MHLGSERSASHDELETAHQCLVDELTVASDIADRGILAAGDALNTIATTALAHVEETERALGKGDRSMAELFRGEAREIAAYIGAFDQGSAALAKTVGESLEAARAIASCAADFDQVVATSDALSVYMKIELARLPGGAQQGNGVGSELGSLSAALKQLATDIGAVSRGLLRELPLVQASVNRMRKNRAAIAGQLDVTLDDLARLGATLEEVLRAETDASDADVLRRSQEALSILQNHDPTIQDLQTVDALTANARTAIGGVDVAPLKWAVRLGDAAPPADGTAANDLAGGEVVEW